MRVRAVATCICMAVLGFCAVMYCAYWLGAIL